MQPSTIRTALVTGAGQGLGSSLVRALASRGVRVYGGCHHLAGVTPVAGAVHLALDVTDPGQIAAAAARITAEVGSLDLVINNAAIFTAGADVPLEETDLVAVERAFQVNALAPLRIAMACVPLLRSAVRSGPGLPLGPCLLNISSEAGAVGTCGRSGWFAYGMSKAALNIQTRQLDNQLRGEGIRVLAVHPGWMRTPMGLASGDPPLEPDAVATALVELVERGWADHGSVFRDWTGEPRPW